MFPAELDDEMLTWILALRDLHFPMSVLRFQKKAKLLIQLHNSSFSASCGWVDKFFTRKIEPVFQSAKNCCIPFHWLIIWMKNQHFWHELIKMHCEERWQSMWFVVQGVKRNIWQFFCQPRHTDKCFHPRLFSGERLT